MIPRWFRSTMRGWQDWMGEVQEPFDLGDLSAEALLPNADRLAVATDLGPEDAARWYPHMIEVADRFSITTASRLAMFLAQTGHESIGFRVLVENLNYTAARLVAVWPARFPDEEAARPFVRSPRKLANKVYSSRMGNGPPGSNDGWRFRGRGLIQLTGRDNYRACGDALGVDLVDNPGLLAQERYAALSAGWYWSSRGLSALADVGSLEAVTRRINGGLHGIEDRRVRWERARAALGQ